MNRCRVAVNLLWIAPGRVGGSEQYLQRQLLGLDAPEFDVELYCTAAFAAAHPELTTRHRVVVAPGGQDWRGGRIAAEHTWLAARTRGAALVHHGGGTTPMIGPRPVLLTVHDLQYRTFPHYFSRARRTYLDAMMPRSVHRATAITVPSEYVRNTVVTAFGVEPGRVRVVPHGIPPVDPPPEQSIERVRSRFGVEGVRFVVYPAITHPHKGHRVLVDMLDRLGDDLHLVLPGGVGAAEAELADAISASRHASRIHRVGRIADAERDALVAGAEALVFPSEYEGFGAPLIEAMALGTPVVCSDAAAVTEVVGTAGVVVAARTAEAWAAGVEEALTRRAELVEAGRRRREDFTIETSGRALAEAYRAVVQEHRS